MRRFSETRRPHPLSTGDQPIGDSIEKERELLAPIRALADLTIDTSKFNVHELRDFIKQKFRGERRRIEDPDLHHQLRLPPRPAAGLRSGLRCALPAQPELHSEIQETDRPESRCGQLYSFVSANRANSSTRITDLLIYLLPHYIREGKAI